VLAQGSPTDKLKVLLNAKELGTCGGDHERFLSLLADHAAKEGINLEVRGVKD